MRFIKILLILFSLAITIGLCYIFSSMFSRDRLTRMPVSGIIYFGILALSSVLNILYHLKSFRFYRRKDKQNLDKKLSKILWAGTLCFSGFLLFLIGTAFYKNTQQLVHSNYNSEEIKYLFVFIAFALLGLFEVSLLKKRIKQLRNEFDA